MASPDPGSSGPRPSLRLIGAGLGLTVLASLVGSFGWPAPRRTTSGWQVADVPPALLALVVGTAVVSAAVAVLLSRPGRLGLVVATTWWAVAGLAVAALVWNDVYLAALRGDGGVIPVFAWLFTFLPVLLVGLVARRSGPVVHRRATLGLAVLVLPLFALGWPLASDARALVSFVGGLSSAVLFGLLPLAAAVFLSRAPRPPATPRVTPAG